MVGFFMGTFANDVKVRKIKYAPNIVYEGEAIKSGNIWIPQGCGTLHFGNGGSNFNIEGKFDGQEAESAHLSMVEGYNQGVMIYRGLGEKCPTRTMCHQDGVVYDGKLSFQIEPIANNTFSQISISFNGGYFLFPEFECIELLDTFTIKYNPLIYRETMPEIEFVEFRAKLSHSNYMELFDRCEIMSDIPYSCIARGKFCIFSDGFECAIEELGVKWTNGGFSMIEHSEDSYYWIKTKYSEGNTLIYLEKADDDDQYYMFHFTRTLSDGTFVKGAFEKRQYEGEVLKTKLIKCADGRSFEGCVTITGSETLKALFSNETLTKNNIRFVSGTSYDANGEEIDTFCNGIGDCGEFPYFE